MKVHAEDVRTIKVALQAAEVLTGPYPTPEGWDEDRRKNMRMIMAAYQALDRISRCKGGDR